MGFFRKEEQDLWPTDKAISGKVNSRWPHARGSAKQRERGERGSMNGSDVTSLSRAALEAEVLRLRQAQEAGGIGLFTIDLREDLLVPTPSSAASMACRWWTSAPPR
jgi:hypothetical protein